MGSAMPLTPARAAPAPAAPSGRAPVLRRCACGGSAPAGGECAECRKKRTELRRSASGPSEPGFAPPLVHEVLRSPGEPLDPATRAYMEPRFGHSFADVRVHADGRAAESAAAVRAHAYTVGRDLVFGARRYAPASEGGRRLIAHELAHVVQQSAAGNAEPMASLEVGGVDAPEERAADAAAERVMGGGAAGPLAAGSAALRRAAAVDEGVVSDFVPNAKVCMVSLHSDEKVALEAAKSLRETHCANLVHLTGSGRHIHVRGGSWCCGADPNRIFTKAGIASHALKNDCADGKKACGSPAEARDALKSWRDTKLSPAISACRGGSGSGLGGPLPVVAFHNNTNEGGLSIDSYKAGGSEAGATDTKRTGGTPNPAVVKGQDPDDYILVTKPDDFDALRGTRNTLLQSESPTDDGSLSVALAGERYVNIERQDSSDASRTGVPFVLNRAMGLQVLAQLGVPPQPCPAPAAAEDAPAASPESPAGETGAAPASGGGSWWDVLQDLLDWMRGQEAAPAPQPAPQPDATAEELERRTADQPPALPRDPVPPSTEECKTFPDQPALDAERDVWKAFLDTMAAPDVIMWILGLLPPPATVIATRKAQLGCMEKAMRAAAAGGKFKMPAGAFGRSGLRSYIEQEEIWRKKFQFVEERDDFDRITDHARARCGSLIAASDEKWSTKKPGHRTCWGVPLLPGQKAPTIPTGFTRLTDEEREQEILQASSAPGISRHHWGTDVDVMDPEMNPKDWKVGKTYADPYSWMARNASTYGFIQSFTADSTLAGPGYIEERWHWSYFPVAQALLEFARAHQAELEVELRLQWSGKPGRYDYISKHWRDYMFNVNQKGAF
jgi:hypothetical protein